MLKKTFYMILFFWNREIIGFSIWFNKSLDKNDMVPKISNSIDQPNSTIWFWLNRLLNRTQTSCADSFWAIFYENSRQNLTRPPHVFKQTTFWLSTFLWKIQNTSTSLSRITSYICHDNRHWGLRFFRNCISEE